MFGERCTLCGSKLNGEGICTECGLNNRRNSDKYYRTGRSACDDQPMSHVHTNWNEDQRQKTTKKGKKDPRAFQRETHPVSQAQREYDREKQKQYQQRTKKKNKGAGLGCLIWVIIMIFFSLIGFFV